MRIGNLACIVVLVLLVPSSQAAFNKPLPFDANYGYMPGLGEGIDLTILSGQATADLGSVTGSFGFFDSQGLFISGLSRVCYRNGSVQCNDSGTNQLALSVAFGGSFGVCFPAAVDAEFEAGHALGLLVDLAADDNLNTFPVDLSFVAPSVDGRATILSVPAIPAAGLGASSITAPPCTTSGGMTALDDVTQIEVRDGTTTLATLTGKNALALFAGQPTVSPIRADFFILPFQSGSTAHFTPASKADAVEGLDLTRVQDLVDKLDSSHQGTTTNRDRVVSNRSEANSEVITTLFNGAIVQLPSGNSSATDITFVRFSRMDVTGRAGGLDWEGRAKLAFEDGKVAGGKPLVGFGYVQLPWWSFLLWGIAIVLFVARLALHPEKKHPVWDRFRWIGWLFGVVAFLLIFFLWDLEIRAMLGASFLSGASGKFRLLLGLLELGMLAFVSFAAAVPIRMALRNGFLLGRQGTFMGIAAGIGAIVGFLLGVTYLRSYLDLLLSQVMNAIA